MALKWFHLATLMLFLQVSTPMTAFQKQLDYLVNNDNKKELIRAELDSNGYHNADRSAHLLETNGYSRNDPKIYFFLVDPKQRIQKSGVLKAVRTDDTLQADDKTEQAINALELSPEISLSDDALKKLINVGMKRKSGLLRKRGNSMWDDDDSDEEYTPRRWPLFLSFAKNA